VIARNENRQSGKTGAIYLLTGLAILMDQQVKVSKIRIKRVDAAYQLFAVYEVEDRGVDFFKR